MGTATSVLRDLEYAEVAYALVVEGFASIFVTNEFLEGSSTDITTWISQDNNITSASVTASLIMQGAYPISLDLREGRFEDRTASFRLNDIDGGLVSLFATQVETTERLFNTVEPTDDPITGQLTVGLNQITASHLGTEYVNEAGERGQNPVVFDGFNHAQYHPGADQMIFPTVPVDKQPVLFQGRRFVLYEVYRDVITYPSASTPIVDNWRPISEAVPIYFGKLDDIGQVKQKTWTLRVSGPGSWLKAELNQVSTDQARPIAASIDLSDDERKIGLQFRINQYVWEDSPENFDGDSIWFQNGFETFGAVDVLVGNTVESLAQSLADVIDKVQNETTNSGKFTAIDGSNVTFDPGTRRFSISTQNKGLINGKNAANWAIMRVCLHEKAWNAFGYSVDQNQFDTDGEDYISISEIQEFKFYDGVNNPELVDTPTPQGWLQAHVSTIPLGYRSSWKGLQDLMDDDKFIDVDNKGDPRNFGPGYDSGLFELDHTLNDGEGQVIFLESEEWRVSNQLDRPPASDPDDESKAFSIPNVGAVDSQRVFVIFGPRRFINTEDVIDEVQIARCSWQDDTGKVAIDPDNFSPVLVIHEWHDPRRFGFDRPKINSPWIGLKASDEDDNRIQIIPLGVWKYWNDQTVFNDLFDVITQRILLTTGESTGWDSFFDDANAKVDAGGNNKTGAHDGNVTVRLDAEEADFGLAIPASFVQSPESFRQERLKLKGTFARCNLYNIGPINAEDLFKDIFNIRGMAWSLHGNQFGIFSLFDPVDFNDVDIVIGIEDIVGNPTNPEGQWPSQDVRVLSPLASVKLDYFFNPLQDDLEKQFIYKSVDKGKWYRHRTVDYPIESRSLPKSGWEEGFRDLWDRGFDFWQRQHFTVTYDLHRIKGNKCWPGTKVVVTDPRLISKAGAYGVTAFTGVVIEVERRPKSKTGEAMSTVTIFIHGEAAIPRFYAPMARAKINGHDSANGRILLEDDFLDIGGNQLDVRAFDEPSWSPFGGDADVAVYQWDRVTWNFRGNVTISSVNIAAGDSYLVLDGPLGFTYFDKMDTIIVMTEHGTQGGAWVRALFAPTGDENGKFQNVVVKPFI